ncbi:LysE family translocator [Chromobacterium haemolyticum]|nr:LysE family translocator [Chromobacterium haemolyticum]
MYRHAASMDGAEQVKEKPAMPEFALLSYVAVMSITPGPNNLMLTASGVNFGFRRTIPHMLGISLGCAFQVFLVGSLLSLLLDGIQAARLPLALMGCAYLLWLSWKIARAGQPEAGAAARAAGFCRRGAVSMVEPQGLGDGDQRRHPVHAGCGRSALAGRGHAGGGVRRGQPAVHRRLGLGRRTFARLARQPARLVGF